MEITVGRPSPRDERQDQPDAGPRGVRVAGTMVGYSTGPRAERKLVSTDARPAMPAYLLVAAWSVGEATVWPIMPDAVLVPLAYARPRDWWRLVLAAAGGTALGCALTHRTGRRRQPGSDRHFLLVRPRMADAARDWLATEGARGARHQPASGVPVKVFAYQAGALGVPLAPFLAWTVAARTARFALAVGGAALARGRVPGVAARHPRLLLAAWAVAFGLGLWRTVVAWSGPANAEGGARPRFGARLRVV